MLTAYDMYTAEIFDEAGIEVLLVGDSASNNVFGNETSLPVTVDELLPLTRAVSRSVRRSLVVGDLPFGSYQRSPEQAYDTAVRFMKEAGAHAVKLEGGREMAPQIRADEPGRRPGDGPHRLHPAERARPRRLPRPGARRHRQPGPRGRPGRAGGRRVRRGDGDGAGRRRRAGHQGAGHPHHRHRRRRRLRRPGAGLAGRLRHALGADGALRQAVRRPARPAARSRPAATPTRSAAAPSPAPTTPSEASSRKRTYRSSIRAD